MTSNVSAIVSAFFAKDYFEGRIKNLAEQSLRPEIVVISQVGSPEHAIALQYKNLIDILVEIPKDKEIPTLYEAWNLGIELSNDEYITNANCDDRLYPGALEKLARVLDENKDISVAYFNVDIVKEIDGVPVGRYNFFEGGFDELFRKGCFLGPMPMWRRSLHEKYGQFQASQILTNGDIYKPRIVSDYEFWLRVASKGVKFMKIDQVLGAYLKREGSLENKEPLRRIWETARAKSEYRKRIEVNIC